MERILLTKDLTARGYAANEIETMVRVGELIRLRRGAYVSGAVPDTPSDRLQHRRLIEATIGQLRDGAVVSHMSAFSSTRAARVLASPRAG